MTRLIVLIVALILPGSLHAACTGGARPYLSCTTKGGQNTLDVCVDNRIVLYAYGPRGQAADLTLARDLREIDYRPWNGIGRTIWEDVSFFNTGYGYTVWFAIDKMRPDAPTEGGVNVTRDGAALADIRCDPGSVTIGMDALYDAYARAGLCHRPGMDHWQPCQ